MAKTHSLRALQAFEAAARCGSFILAAEELGVSPAAISQLIRGLEAQTGRLLFVRSKRSIQLSEAGREVLPRLITAFHDIRETTEVLNHRAARPRLVVSIPSSVATGWLPNRLPDFLASEPDVSIRLREDQDPIDLEAERIDLRFSYGAFPQPGAKIIAQMTDHVIAVCTKQYLKNYGPRGSAELFTVGRLISTDWGQASARFPNWPDFVGEKTERPLHTVSSSHAALVLANAGVGVALVQVLYAAEFLRSGKLVLAHPRQMKMAQPYCVSIRAASREKPLVQRFADWFVSQLNAELELPSAISSQSLE